MHKTDDLIAKLKSIRNLVDECLMVATSGKKIPKIDLSGSVEMRQVTPTFELNERAFVKRYCKNLNGAGKFVLILAYLTHGDESKDIPLNDIKRLWNKMTADALLGMTFNGKYPTDAKERGWVNSRKQGHYSLSENWTDIFRI